MEYANGLKKDMIIYLNQLVSYVLDILSQAVVSHWDSFLLHCA